MLLFRVRNKTYGCLLLVTMLVWVVFLQTKQEQAAIVGCFEMLKPPPIQLFISVLWPISDEYRGGGEIQ